MWVADQHTLVPILDSTPLSLVRHLRLRCCCIRAAIDLVLHDRSPHCSKMGFSFGGTTLVSDDLRSEGSSLSLFLAKPMATHDSSFSFSFFPDLYMVSSFFTLYLMIFIFPQYFRLPPFCALVLLLEIHFLYVRTSFCRRTVLRCGCHGGALQWCKK